MKYTHERKKRKAGLEALCFTLYWSMENDSIVENSVLLRSGTVRTPGHKGPTDGAAAGHAHPGRKLGYA